MFSHVKMMGNSVAHGLAKVSKTCNRLLVWLEEAPNEIARLVMADKVDE